MVDNNLWDDISLLMPNIDIKKVNIRLLMSKYMRITASGEVLDIFIDGTKKSKIEMIYIDKFEGIKHSLVFAGLSFPKVGSIRSFLEVKKIILVKIKVKNVFIDGKRFL